MDLSFIKYPNQQTMAEYLGEKYDLTIEYVSFFYNSGIKLFYFHKDFIKKYWTDLNNEIKSYSNLKTE